MNYGPNTVGQLGIGGYRASANPVGMTTRVMGVTFDWDSVDPIEGNNESATLTITATGGTYTLSYGGQTTGAIAEAAAAATVEEALEGLSSIGNGNVMVSGNAGGPYTIEFVEDLRHTDATAITTDGALLTGGAATAVVSGVVAGAADADEELPGGVTAKAGTKVLRAGSIIAKGSGDKYELATNASTLVRGECYVVDRHYFEDIDTDYLGEIFDEGTVFYDRLLIGGTGQVTAANFLTAFPSVRLLRE